VHLTALILSSCDFYWKKISCFLGVLCLKYIGSLFCNLTKLAVKVFVPKTLNLLTQGFQFHNFQNDRNSFFQKVCTIGIFGGHRIQRIQKSKTTEHGDKSTDWPSFQSPSSNGFLQGYRFSTWLDDMKNWIQEIWELRGDKIWADWVYIWTRGNQRCQILSWLSTY